MTIGEDRNKNWSKNRKLCFCTQLSFQYNWSVELAHYCTCFSNTCVQFVVLSTFTQKYDSKILKLLRPMESYFICLERTLDRVPYNLSFSCANFHASIQDTSENRSSAYWRSLLFELNNTRSSASIRRRTLHFSNTTPLEKKLSLSVLSMYIMNRRGERTQPCHSPTLTLKGFIFMPLTRIQISDRLLLIFFLIKSMCLLQYRKICCYHIWHVNRLLFSSTANS